MYKGYHYLLLLAFAFLIISCKKSNSDESSATNLPTATEDSIIPKAIVNEPKAVVKDTSTKVVVVLGSSTAAGWGASRYDSCWVSRLQNRFNKDSMRVKVINLSSPGYVTYHGMPSNYSPPNGRPWFDGGRNISKALTYHPTLIIFNYPTNDISSNYSDNEILGNYDTLVKIMNVENVEYIITGTQPRNFSEIQRQRLKDFNDLMEPLYRTHYINYLNKLSTVNCFIQDKYSAGDGIHLNDKGHQVIYESLMSFPLLKKVIGY